MISFPINQFCLFFNFILMGKYSMHIFVFSFAQYNILKFHSHFVINQKYVPYHKFIYVTSFLHSHSCRHLGSLETVSDFILGGSKITAVGDCSHEIKRRLVLWSKVVTNLDSILKSRDITLATKVHLVKAMVFPVIMYGCESWTIKKAECQRIDAFELWCWRRLLRYLGQQGDPTSPS